MKNISTALKTLRAMNDMDQIDLAKRLQEMGFETISRAKISAWEQLDDEMLKALSKVFKVDVKKFLQEG